MRDNTVTGSIRSNNLTMRSRRSRRVVGHTFSARGVGIALSVCVLAGAAIIFLRFGWNTKPHWTSRPLAGRLTDLPYAPLRSTIRRGSMTLPADAFGRGTRTEPRSAQSLFAVAVDSVALDRLDHAAALLSEAAAKDERYGSDLAAVLYEIGARDGDPQVLARALVLADHAIALDPARPEPQFNRALILARMGLDDAAARQFDSWERVETDSRWIADVAALRARLQHPIASEEWTVLLPRLRAAAENGAGSEVATIVERFPQQSRSWSEGVFLAEWAAALQKSDRRGAERSLSVARAVGRELFLRSGDSFVSDSVAAIDRASPAMRSVLAAGHQSYDSGRRHLAARDLAAAIPLLDSAASSFRDGDSPMELAATRFLASAWFDSNDPRRAQTLCDGLARRVPSRYRARASEIAWLQGTMSGSQGSLYAALQSYRTAREGFEVLRESALAARMADFEAQMLSRLGRHGDAARLRFEAFHRAGATGDRDLTESMLTQAASDDAAAERWDIARSFYDLALDCGGRNLRRRAYNLRGRALAAWRMGDIAQARNDIERATLAAGAIADLQLRASALNDVKAAHALLLGESDPAGAFSLLGEAIAFARSARAIDLPELYVERARAARRLGWRDAARADASAAIAEVESRRSAIDGDVLRDAFLTSSLSPYDELFDLAEEDGDLELAFRTAELERGRLLYDANGRTGLASLRDLSRALPAKTALLHYTSLPDRIVVLAIDSQELRHARIAMPRTRLVHEIAGLHAAMEHDDVAARRAAATLHRALIEPVADTLARANDLVLVTDDIIGGVPFAALAGSDGRFLAETWTLRSAPSAAACLDAATVAPGERGPSHAFVAGDPSFDSDRYPELPRLAGAADEAREVARMYGVPPLLGAAATTSAFQKAMRESTILHVGAHAIVDAGDPDQSALLFSDGVVRIRDLNPGTVRAAVVVLAGCRTGARPNRSDLSSFAGAFLSRGAGAVVASLWDVPDGETAELMVRFHRHLLAGERTELAFALAQRELIALKKRPSVWSAFQVYSAQK